MNPMTSVPSQARIRPSRSKYGSDNTSISRASFGNSSAAPGPSLPKFHRSAIFGGSVLWNGLYPIKGPSHHGWDIEFRAARRGLEMDISAWALPAGYRPHRLHDRPRREAVFFEQLIRIAAFGETVADVYEADRNGRGPGGRHRDGRAQSAVRQMFFSHDDGPRLAGRVHYRLLVKRFGGVHVDHAHRNALAGQLGRR